jgi:hypothetical protein
MTIICFTLKLFLAEEFLPDALAPEELLWLGAGGLSESRSLGVPFKLRRLGVLAVGCVAIRNNGRTKSR